MTSNRIEYIDFTKGLTILLVILGHVEFVPLSLQSWIYSFHMPIFFILSGYFLRENTSYREAFRKMFRSLIVPYFIIGVMIRILGIIRCYHNNLPIDWIDISSLPLVLYNFGNGLVSAGAIWFLPVLFLARLLWIYYHKLSFGIPLMLVMATLSMIITEKTSLITPFGIQEALVAVVFLEIGYQVRKCNIINSEQLNKYPLIISLLVLTLLWGPNVPLAMRDNSYPIGMMNIITASFMSLIITLIIKKKYQNLKINTQIISIISLFGVVDILL